MSHWWDGEELGHPCCGDYSWWLSNNREFCQHQPSPAPGHTVFTALLQPGQASKHSQSLIPTRYYQSWSEKFDISFESCRFSLSGWFRFLTTNALCCPLGSSRIILDISNFSFNARDGFVSGAHHQESETTTACKNKISIPGLVCLWGTKQRKPKMTIIIQSGQRSCNSTCSSLSSLITAIWQDLPRACLTYK